MLRRALLRAALRLRRTRRGTDVLSLMPESVLVALRRDGLDPVLDQSEGPVRRVPLPWGFRGWLVTGYDESKAVLSAAGAFSNDFRHLVGTAGIGTGRAARSANAASACDAARGGSTS